MPGLLCLTRSKRSLVAVIALGLLALAGCAETQLAVHTVKEVRREIEGSQPAAPERYKLGMPYRVSGVWYYPRYEPDYDRIGVASWYGPKFHGRPTANGERFDMNGLTAAHPTLPMPSRVRVTNLENRRALVLRVNDRGPFVNGRIIDISRRGAQLLGFHRKGVAEVRVQYLGLDSLTPGKPPPSKQPIVIASDPVAAARKLKPAVSTEEAQPPPIKVEARADQGEASPPVLVEVAVFKTRDFAHRLGERVRPLGAVAIEPERRGDRVVYPVRIGPVGSGAEADSILAQLAQAGFTKSHIVVARHR